MGCGAVCETNTPTSLKHAQQSKKTMLGLIPSMAISNPLLSPQQLQHFVGTLRINASCFTLPLTSAVLGGQELPAGVIDKWRTLLFGLDKGDYVYARCLGFETADKKTKGEPQSLPSLSDQPNDIQYHACFPQIEKDLSRTFDFKLQTRKIFQHVLKRISNHFPIMGYTQGVNFIVGYLLLLGYSQSDTFWLFIHLSMNKRYLLLGLYQDGFPLASIYTLLFRNILKRVDQTLYHHLFQSLLLDDSIWIFKWFITCYIYSFPLVMVKYAWDVMIELGAIGLVLFAVGIVTALKQPILAIGDQCDMSQFLQGLKQLDKFNQFVRINQVVQFAYQTKVYKDDFEGVQQLKPSFYQQYYKIYQQQLPQYKSNKKIASLPALKSPMKSPRGHKEDKLTHHLHVWYIKLLEERVKFAQKEQERQLKDEVPSEIKEEDYKEMQKSLQIIEEKIIQNQSAKYSHRILPAANGQLQTSGYFSDLIFGEPLEPEWPESRIAETVQYNHQSFQNPDNANNTRLQTKMSYNVGQQIDQLEQYSDSNGEDDKKGHKKEVQEVIIQKQKMSQKEDKISQKEGVSYMQGKFKHAQVFNMNTLGLDNIRKGRQAVNKVSNIKIDSGALRSGFSLAGQNILNNFSGTISQYSSVESKNSYRPKKQKQNNLMPPIKTKTKTEALSQLSRPSNDFSSSRQSSLDHFTDKDSFSGFTQRQRVPSGRPQQNDDYLTRKTHQQLMAVSHGPQKQTISARKGLTSQIELFAGDNLFKKKKRPYNRNSIVTSIGQQVNALNVNGGSAMPVTNKRTINDQQSLESILELSRCHRGGGVLQSLPSEIGSSK